VLAAGGDGSISAWHFGQTRSDLRENRWKIDLPAGWHIWLPFFFFSIFAIKSDISLTSN
jgi:hypothetical protein